MMFQVGVIWRREQGNKYVEQWIESESEDDIEETVWEMLHKGNIDGIPYFASINDMDLDVLAVEECT